MSSATFRNPARSPSAVRRAGTVAALVSAGFLVLTGCSRGDSTVSGDPTTTTAASTTTSAAATSTSASASASGTAAQDGSTSANGSGAASGADTPPDHVEIDARGQKFIDALRAKGVAPALDPSLEVATGDFICNAINAGTNDDEMLVWVTAAVGTISSNPDQPLAHDQAEATARTYIDVARTSYCNS